MGTLLTIGYEGASIDDFVATLMHAGVETVIDIRDVPVSRKPGFSKNRLASTLEQAGVGYVHLRALGDPKAGREAAKSGDVERFQRIFCTHMEKEEAQAALAEAIVIAATTRAALLCFERNHAGCHRNMVAEAMAAREPFTVHHLGVPQGIAQKRSNGHGVFGNTYAVG